MKPLSPRPDWLYQITYGLAERSRVLIDGTRFAIVQTPGGRWWDNSGKHYGGATYYLVDKEQQLRKGYGLLDCRELQQGGRAKTAQWKLLVEQSDKDAKARADAEGTVIEGEKTSN